MNIDYQNFLIERENQKIAAIDETISFLYKKLVSATWQKKEFWRRMIDECLDERLRLMRN